MNDVTNKHHGVDLARYAENRAKYPLDQLLNYAGLHVAWSPDGTQIVASDPDEEALWRQLESRGLDPSQVVFDFIDPLYDQLDQDACRLAPDAVPAGNPASHSCPARSGPRLEPPDMSQYFENRAKYPLDELIKYAGQYLAWSPDGLRILASGPDEESIERQLEARGIDPSQVVLDYIDPLYDEPSE